MTGAITGDYAGSAYEFNNTRDYNFPIITGESGITDDSILTIAVADAILHDKSYGECLHYWGNKSNPPKGGYGGLFYKWLKSDNPKPYNSWGNGSAMRVSPAGWAFNTLEKTLAEAKKSAECTHNHPEGIKGAQAIAASVYLLRTGSDKQNIKNFVETEFGYDLDFKLADIRSAHTFDESCMDTVPKSIVCFLESRDFEDAIRLAVSLGGDSDTLACITGAMAEAAYGTDNIPKQLITAAVYYIPEELSIIYHSFVQKFINKK
ncbi:MAG: ADP-ribosylglycohydrolase family protein [Prevotellaceae bacterium]|jgi:ADP-ribosylglycohydrolase|nr:ADP-ribosylglycohydrolase family protein [Prevotellaceae bacterium]